MYCNNCGSKGHVFKTCKDPITSCGILLIRGPFEKLTLPANPVGIHILMVKRKDSMAYMEFIRGKYDPTDTDFIKRLFSNMTQKEQKLIVSESFDTLWSKLWGKGRDTHSVEYELAKGNYNKIDRTKLISESLSPYVEPEWGFPKGRRSKGESDLQCGLREFLEETNIPAEAYDVYEDLCFTEVFTGTNNVKYKHVYYVAIMKNSKLINTQQQLTHVQRREISEVGWKTLAECKQVTRPHYVERKQLIDDLERRIQTYQSLATK
jgi:8-oxo-dGTP pyrophosphatase MutT (NUDIX family)